MKTPPFLIGAALLFWGWQSGFLLVGAIMAVVLESARYIKARWEFSDDDFSRIWTICTLLFLGSALYAFTDSGGPARYGSFFQDPSPATQTGAGAATSRTASAILRWLPMVLFLFVVAQAYSAREEIPLSTISLILRKRWKRAVRLGRPLPAQRGMNVSYPYFAICIFAASVHPGENNFYFWGFCLLLAWALWSRRTRRFGVVIWILTLAFTFSLSFFGQHGLGRLQNYLQNIDAQWFERFARRRGVESSQSKTQLGRIGQLKTSGKIVIRVEPEDGSLPPEYLREASYRLFAGTVWRAGGSRDTFQAVQQETNGAAFLLVPGKATFAKANITCYLDGYSRESQSPTGLLPLPSGAARLENLPVFVLKANNLGAVLAEGPGLLTFDVGYGPGVTLDSPFDPSEFLSLTNFNYWRRRANLSSTNELGENPELETNPDLFVSPREEPALNQVIADWNVPKGNRLLAIRAISSFFQSNFTYSTWQDLPDFRSTNQTPLGLFLLRTHSGHCEYFATATVLLLRKLGVPARYAVGYAVHEKSGNEYVVRLRDGHAWCLVWNENSKIWQDFDTTPTSWVEEENKSASPFQMMSDLWSWLGFQFSKFRWGQSNLRQSMLLALVPVLLILVYQIFYRQRRKRRGSARDEKREVWPGLDSEFYLIEKKLAQRGLVRHPQEPLSDWLRRALSNPALAATGDPLRELLQLHYRYRFDPKGLTDQDREELRQTAKSLLQKMAELPA